MQQDDAKKNCIFHYDISSNDKGRIASDRMTLSIMMLI